MIIANTRLLASARHSASALALATAAVAPSAFAQTAASQAADTPASTQGLEEIIVTAERRSADVQKTPAAVTVQSGDDLLQRGKFTLTNILETVPGVSGGESEGVSNNPTGNDSPAAGITIRGISSNGALVGQTVPGVTATAIYVDDVYGGVGGSYDIDRVEVLRGPQGTLYGRSATAGLIAIHTRAPNLEDRSMEVSLEGGNLDLFHVTGAVNLPIIEDKLALRVAGNHYERDGADVESGYGATNTDEAKAKLLFKPTDNFSLLIGGALQNRQYGNGGAVGNLVSPNKFSYTPSTAGEASTKFRQVWAQVNWDIGGVQLTYLPAYRTWKQNATVYAVGPGGAIIEQIVTTPKDEFITQEIRIASDNSSGVKWQTGLFYYQNSLVSDNLNQWQSSSVLMFDAYIHRKTYDIGVFAEGTVPVTDNLRVTGGLRYNKTTVKTEEDFASNTNTLCYTPAAFNCPAAAAGSPLAGTPADIITASVGGAAGRRVFRKLSYKARIEYDLSPTNLLYASVSSASLPGDVQIGTGANSTPTVNIYQSEGLTSYEVGSKNRFFDRRLQINLGIFHYDYGGYQLSILQNPLDPSSGYLYNVPMRMTGAELELLLQATSADRVSFNFSHIDAPFHDRPAGFADYAVQKKLWGFSPTTATLSYDHDFALAGGSNITFRGEGIWRAGYYVQALSAPLAAQGGLPYNYQKAFIQGNVNLTWTSTDGRFSLTGYVRNVTNYRYKTYVNLQSLSPLQASGTQSDPRTAGAVLTARF